MENYQQRVEVLNKNLKKYEERAKSASLLNRPIEERKARAFARKTEKEIWLLTLKKKRNEQQVSH